MKKLQTHHIIVVAKTRGGCCDSKCRGCLTYHDLPYDGKPKWACTVFGKLLDGVRTRPQECVNADISAILINNDRVTGMNIEEPIHIRVEEDK